MSLIQRLDHIEAAIKKLQLRCRELEMENEELRLKNSQNQELLKKRAEEINNLEEQNKISKLAEGLSVDQDRKQMKAQIDELIDEIDHCIKLVKK